MVRERTLRWSRGESPLRALGRALRGLGEPQGSLGTAWESPGGEPGGGGPRRGLGGEPWGFLGGALGRGPEASAWEEPWRSLGGGSGGIKPCGSPGEAREGYTSP